MYAHDKQSPSGAWVNKLTGIYVCVCKSQLCNAQGHDIQLPHTLICFVWCGIHVHTLVTIMYACVITNTLTGSG